jgi:hypothetical protein
MTPPERFGNNLGTGFWGYPWNFLKPTGREYKQENPCMTGLSGILLKRNGKG